jgi:hypothetical protein
VLSVPVPDSSDYYYVSYRRAIGFDANLSGVYSERVSVHRGPAGAAQTYYLGSVGDGQLLSDPATGFSVRQTRHDNYTASVFIEQGQSCGQRPPSLTVNPVDASAVAGTAVTYVVTARNNDATACSPTTFSLSVSSPSGWSTGFSPSQLSLAPGASSNTTLTVASNSSSAPGKYDLLLRAQDTAISGHYGEAAASYTVVSQCGKTPDISLSPSSQEAVAGVTLTYSVRVSNADAANCGPSTFSLQASAPAGWSAVLPTVTVSVAPGAASTSPVALTSGPLSAYGPYVFEVRASDPLVASRINAASANYNVLQADNLAPTAPTNLSATLKRRAVSLSWQASSDNVGVAGYRILRNGSVISMTSSTTWVDQSTSSGDVYSITAVDFAGNVSAPSNSATLGSGGGTNKGKK